MIELIDEIEALDTVICDHRAEISNMYARRDVLVRNLQHLCEHPSGMILLNTCTICGKEMI